MQYISLSTKNRILFSPLHIKGRNKGSICKKEVLLCNTSECCPKRLDSHLLDRKFVVKQKDFISHKSDFLIKYIKEGVLGSILYLTYCPYINPLCRQYRDSQDAFWSESKQLQKIKNYFSLWKWKHVPCQRSIVHT